MANPWFRMYAEFATDAKVQMLSEAMQRRYLMLMCLRCSNTLVTLHDEEIAFQLRISGEELAETKALFIKKGFIDSAWNVLNWEKRQFASDTSKDRVAKHRALQKAKHEPAGNGVVTLHERKANALDTDTDTDTDKEPPSGVQGGKPPKPPKSPSVEIPDWVPVEPWRDFVAMRREKGKRAPFTVAAAKGIIADLGRLREQGHDVAGVLSQSVVNGWSGVFAIKRGGPSAITLAGDIGSFV